MSDPFELSSSRPMFISYPQDQIDGFQARYGTSMQIVYHYQGVLSDFDQTRSRHPFRSWKVLPCKLLEINSILTSRGQAPLSTIHYLQYVHPLDFNKIVTIFELSNGVNVKWIRLDDGSPRSSSYKFSVYDPVKDKWTFRTWF